MAIAASSIPKATSWYVNNLFTVLKTMDNFTSDQATITNNSFRSAWQLIGSGGLAIRQFTADQDFVPNKLNRSITSKVRAGRGFQINSH
jgi:hypothetical protein